MRRMFRTALTLCLGAGLLAGAWTAAGGLSLTSLLTDGPDAQAELGLQGTWQLVGSAGTHRLAVRRVPCERSTPPHACTHIRYDFSPDSESEAGLRLPLGGLDASAYDHLAFSIKGDAAIGFGQALRVGFKKPDPEHVGAEEAGSYVVSGIGRDWQRVLIPLRRMSGLRDWCDLSEFFIALHPRRSEVPRGGYYLGDLAFVHTGSPGPSIWDAVVAGKKRAWERAAGSEAALKLRLQSRLRGWPERLFIDRERLPSDDTAFLERLARDTWRGLAALSDRENGLPIDTVAFGASLDPREARIGDYTSTTNIGLYLMAVAAAEDLGYLSRGAALAHIRQLLTTLEGLERHAGFFYNYYDTTSLERTSHLISFVDSAWLTAGLMVSRTRYPELYGRCTRLIDEGDYGFFYDPVTRHMSHGYYANLPGRSEYHYGLLYTEARIGSLIAIGKEEVPRAHWWAMQRTPAEAAGAPSGPHPVETGYGGPGAPEVLPPQGSRYLLSWGGSMFEALMPTLVVDESRHAGQSLGPNNLAHALIQRQYATEVLAYPVWGISPSSAPDGLSYQAYGVELLGARAYPPGAVTPHASALALALTPEAAIANLRDLVRRYDIYGEYGLYDAVDPRSGQVARTYLALDQAMLFIALANHLKAGSIQRAFESDAIARRALEVMAAEEFFPQTEADNLSRSLLEAADEPLRQASR